ncbi:MAG: sulfurtransferase [Deltaproteobacteria bacterium]|nr:MAG: sulfurtransferase [Deltaproteobacteria bacterium]
MRGMYLMLRHAWLAGFVTFFVGCFATIEQPQGKPYTSTKGWVLTGQQAKAMHDEGALFIDVRDNAHFKKLHIAKAVHTTWQHFSESKAPNQGKLLQSTTTLNQRLQTLGVSKDKAVVVYGSPAKGWGEEGRIAWMLRVFGHSKVYIVDGGYLALVQAGVPTSKAEESPAKGNFTVQQTTTYAINRDNLQKLVVKDKAVPKSVTVIDTRELREYQGQTPYGESRGGHIPGAVHLHFQSLLNSMGYLKPKAEMLQTLKKLGAEPGRPVVVYCTGGIRSGWLAFVMLDMGFTNVKNYAGSMWEWAAAPAASYPLEKTQ